MKTLLQNIPVKMTTTVNGHVVTRWSEFAYEVDTWGKLPCVGIDEALSIVKSERQ